MVISHHEDDIWKIPHVDDAFALSDEDTDMGGDCLNYSRAPCPAGNVVLGASLTPPQVSHAIELRHEQYSHSICRDGPRFIWGCA